MTRKNKCPVGYARVYYGPLIDYCKKWLANYIDRRYRDREKTISKKRSEYGTVKRYKGVWPFGRSYIESLPAEVVEPKVQEFMDRFEGEGASAAANFDGVHDGALGFIEYKSIYGDYLEIGITDYKNVKKLWQTAEQVKKSGDPYLMVDVETMSMISS